MAHRTLTLGPNDAGQRLDRFLRKLLPDIPRGVLFKWIRNRAVTVNGRRAKPDTRLQVGDVVKVPVEVAGTEAAPRVPVDLDVVYENEALLAVNKPAGLLTHGGDDSLADRVLAYLGMGDSHTFRPAPAHRLDRNTSGLVLVGKTAKSARALAQAIRERRLRKQYLALVTGLHEAQGEIDVPLARDEGVSRANAQAGAKALTRYRVVKRCGAFSLVELDLVTGRTHQLRVHLAHLGAPICGDRKYGAALSPNLRASEVGRLVGELKRPFLHAAQVTVPPEVMGHGDEPLVVQAPLPPELHVIYRACFRS